MVYNRRKLVNFTSTVGITPVNRFLKSSLFLKKNNNNKRMKKETRKMMNKKFTKLIIQLSFQIHLESFLQNHSQINIFLFVFVFCFHLLHFDCVLDDVIVYPSHTNKSFVACELFAVCCWCLNFLYFFYLIKIYMQKIN